MVVKAYLRGEEDAIPLSADRTTIGRSGVCDIVINDCHLDPEHCVIEICDCDHKMILTDLNTTSGTYVNSCLVRNAVVEVGQGDVIQLGKQGRPMKIVINNVVNECSMKQQQGSLNRGLKLHKVEMPYWKSQQPSANTNNDLLLPSLNIKHSTSQPTFSQSSSPPNELNELLREKDRKIVQMSEEINRLSFIENELKQKDRIIATMQQHTFQKPTDSHHRCGPNRPSTASGSFRNNRHNDQQHLDQGSRLLFQKINEENHRNEKLRVELDDVRRSYQSSQGLTHSLQNELSNKEALLIKNSSQLESLKKQLKQGEQKISILSSRCTKLVEENRTEQLEKQLSEMKSKWKVQESRLRNQIDLLQNYKDELMKVTNNQQILNNEKSQVSKEAAEMKQQFYQLQRTEKLLRVDKEQLKALYEKFRTKMMYLLSTADPQFDADANEVPADNVIINRTKKVFLERNELQLSKKDLEKSLRNLEQAKSESAKEKEQCQEVLKGCLETINLSGRKTAVLEREVDKLVQVDSRFSWAAKYAAGFLRGELKSLQAFERSLLSINQTPNPKKSAIDYIKEMHQRNVNAEQQIKMLEDSVVSLKQDHEVEKRRLQEEIHENLAQEHQLEMENLRDQIKSACQEDLFKSLEEQKGDFEQQLEAEKEKFDQLKEEITTKIEVISEKENVIEEIRQELEDAKNKIEEQISSEKARTLDVAAMEEACQSSVQKMKEQMEMVKTEAETKVRQYEEESKQHSLTIVALEEKLQQAQKELELKNQTPVETPSTPVNKKPENEEEIEIMKSEVMTLKSELFMTRETLKMQQDRNTKLMRDLRGAESRLSDMTGELSEAMKEELEYNRTLVKNLQLETTENQQKLLKMSELVEQQKQKLNNQNETITKQTKALEENNKKEVVLKPDTKEQSCEVDIKSQEEIDQAEPRCHGERHQQVILRQREALAELREQVKALEQIQAPLPGQEQALKQVVMLKRELAEIRAKKAMQEEEEKDKTEDLIPPQNTSEDPNHLLLAATAQASLERSSRQQLQESVIASEKTYMDLVTTICPLLEVGSTPSGNRSFSHIPPDEREKLTTDRKHDLELFSGHIKSLKQRLDQRERLLQNYESDLGKFREAETAATMKSKHLDLLRQNLIDKSEEANNLRRALDEKRAECESEKRLNAVIKQRKDHRCKELYPPSYENNPTKIRPSPPSSANRSKTKRLLELKKRRDYEFEVLKKEKELKERELCQTTAQLVNLRNSLKREMAS